MSTPTDPTMRHLIVLLQRIERTQQRRREFRDRVRRRTERETCMACGCLCLADECCPGCRAKRQQEKRSA